MRTKKPPAAFKNHAVARGGKTRIFIARFVTRVKGTAQRRDFAALANIAETVPASGSAQLKKRGCPEGARLRALWVSLGGKPKVLTFGPVWVATQGLDFDLKASLDGKPKFSPQRHRLDSSRAHSQRHAPLSPARLLNLKHP
ncbi:hypothetical protein CWS43_07010 [Rahnella sp. AA]|nr:hypothetical protein CWS43_07010 [Rahnella sp. AA]